MWVRATHPAVSSDLTRKGSLVAKMISVFPVSVPRVYPQVLSLPHPLLLKQTGRMFLCKHLHSPQLFEVR